MNSKTVCIQYIHHQLLTLNLLTGYTILCVVLLNFSVLGVYQTEINPVIYIYIETDATNLKNLFLEGLGLDYLG